MMVRSHQSRARRAASVRYRAASPEENHFARCTVPFCGRPTQRAAKSGLSTTRCDAHIRFAARHGDPECPSPSGAALRPYVKAASSWLRRNRAGPEVHVAREQIHDLLASSGDAIIALRLRSLPPGKRAQVALARLRDAGTKPELLIAVCMAVHALAREAPAVCRPRNRDWLLCAVGKACSRRRGGSGTHQRWTDPDSGRVLSERHTYPRVLGKMLRRLGALIEDACEPLIAARHALPEVVELKVSRYGAHPSIADPLKFAAEAQALDARRRAEAERRAHHGNTR